jgi:septin family protein
VIELTNSTHHAETLSVLPFVGPGGIGKRTFAQQLYNDKRIEAQFAARIRVCVSTDFDVIKLTRQILSCIFNLETAQRQPWKKLVVPS